jgi:hypothetical protein
MYVYEVSAVSEQSDQQAWRKAVVFWTQVSKARDESRHPFLDIVAEVLVNQGGNPQIDICYLNEPLRHEARCFRYPAPDARYRGDYY